MSMVHRRGGRVDIGRFIMSLVGRVGVDDSFPCPWSTGVEEEWILENSSRLWSADAGR